MAIPCVFRDATLYRQLRNFCQLDEGEKRKTCLTTSDASRTDGVALAKTVEVVDEIVGDASATVRWKGGGEERRETRAGTV